MDEVMLYKIMEHGEVLPEEHIVSVLPLTEEDKPQVRELILNRLSLYFEGVNDKWADSLFEGYEQF